ncbi:MAG: hypothetical protein KHY61_00690, partial [Sutterella wadsworthensis]|nr:hypothetical protein [Sutterella wadsworthensis]
SFSGGLKGSNKDPNHFLVIVAQTKTGVRGVIKVAHKNQPDASPRSIATAGTISIAPFKSG